VEEFAMSYAWAQQCPIPDATPEEMARIEEACVAINRLPDPLQRVLRLVITGSSPLHIAKVTGLTLGRVEQLRATFVRHIERGR
jgi:DNA-directed RNA polymerase specialized sigma24 family protein